MVDWAAFSPHWPKFSALVFVAARGASSEEDAARYDGHGLGNKVCEAEGAILD
jgi:hypothetical protein